MVCTLDEHTSSITQVRFAYLKDTQKEIKEACVGEKEYEELQDKRIQNKKKHNTFQTLTSASSKFLVVIPSSLYNE